jgi:hypothetical protein
MMGRPSAQKWHYTDGIGPPQGLLSGIEQQLLDYPADNPVDRPVRLDTLAVAGCCISRA